MASIQYEKDFRAAVRVDEEFLKALHSLMSEFLPDVPPQVVIKTDGQLKITTAGEAKSGIAASLPPHFAVAHAGT